MTQKEQIQLFEAKKVRTVWNDEHEKWYFSIVDVVEVLTDSADPKLYIKKMKSRDPELDSNWGTICTLVRMKGQHGKSGRFSDPLYAQLAHNHRLQSPMTLPTNRTSVPTD